MVKKQPVAKQQIVYHPAGTIPVDQTHDIKLFYQIRTKKKQVEKKRYGWGWL